MSTRRTEILTLISPHGGEPAIFNVHADAKIPEETNEIIQIIKLLGDDFAEAKALLTAHRTLYNTNDCRSTLILCEQFNKWSSTLSSNMETSSRPRCSKKLIKYLMSLIYNRAVQEPGKLNQYEAFSPEVYGETGFDIIEQMLARVPLDSSDIFLDLGSGVGNVVLHVAAISQCKVCYGFEKAEWPAKFAKLMEKEFIFWMSFFGKSYSQFKIYKADFLSDEETCQDKNNKTTTMNEYVKEIVNDAKIVFVNNYAFGAEVDHQLKMRFCNMTEGSFIISSKAFCPLNFRINSRNLNDIGTMLNLDIFEPLSGHVSWTDKIINYYFQKIDRTLLEKYFEKRNNPSLAICNGGKEGPIKMHSPTGSAASSYSSSSPSSMTSSSTTTTTNTTDTDSQESHDLNEERTRKRDKSKDVKRKRKKTHSHSAASRSPSPVSRHKEKKKKSSSSKKDKLLVVKKSDLNHSSKAKIIITKSNEKTLENFHSFTKKSTCKPDGKLLGNQVKTAKNSNYNAASLASLANENLSGSNLKDIVKKSPNFVKKLNNFHNAGSVNRSLSEHERCANNNGSGVKLKKAAIDLDLDEKRLKRELGEETVKAVESYFNTLRRNYYRYLIHRKSSEFSEKIQDEIKKEHDIKKEYLKYTRKFELDTDSLLKTNVDLLKRRTDELGIKNLQYPHEIISHAQELLSDHKELLEKIEKADKEVKQKKILNNQLEPESRSHNTNKKSLYADTSIPPIQKATAPKPPPKSTLLDKLLSVIDSKNTENLPATTTTAITTITSSSITTTTSNSTNSAQNKKKPLPTPKLLATQTSQSSSYDSQSSEKENLNNTLEITLPSIIKRETHVDDILIDVDDVRSVESLPNSDTTTITANERGGAIDEDGTDTDNNEVASVSDKKLVTKCKNNISSFVQHSKGVNNSNVSNLKNFKIPKQNTIKSEATPTAILAPLPTQMATADQIKASSFALVDVTSSTPTNTSSTLVNPLAFDFNNPQKSTNYYHPKKNQFRQYMMESSTISICKSEPESSSSLAAAPVVSDSS